MKKSAIYRIIDANLNRAREGLRVCEDTARFILNNSNLSLRFKRIRHRLTEISKRLPTRPTQLIKARNSQDDIGKYLFAPDQKKYKKRQVKEIFIANIRRTEEAMRVLEEFSKTIDKEISDNFGKLRFKIYALEKETLGCFH